MKIGVFDSGVGGLSVAQAIEKAMPEYEILFRNDAQHVPYGTKPAAELMGYVEPILQGLVMDGCEVIVIACNTVSTTLIEDLRKTITVPLIGLEPMVKPAAKLTKSGVIAVCATPTTLASERYKWLKNEYAKDIKVVEPDCSSWTRMIEDKKLDEAVIADEINDALTLGADVIVLGCTHYHWIEEEIKAIAGDKAAVIQPEAAIIKQLKKVIQEASS
jgi:glutamate racemase